MSFIYLATPYSKYKAGIEEANKMASRHAAEFLRHKLPVFCPIAHSHSISVHGGMSAKDHAIWMPLDYAFCDVAFALVVAEEEGWKESYGVNEEIKYMTALKKPVYFWQPPKLDENSSLYGSLLEDLFCYKAKNLNPEE